MAAFVEHEFEKSFILDEERLRKISDIITSRIDDFIKEGSPRQQRDLQTVKLFLKTLATSKDVVSEEEWNKALKSISSVAEISIENYRAIKYKVYRGDFYFITENIQDVINEENYEWKKIEQIEVTSGERGIFTINLTFTRKGRFHGNQIELN